MNTPKRLLSGSDDLSESSVVKRRSRTSSQDWITPIDDQIEQVAKRHRVPTDTVKRIVSDLLTESSVVDYLRIQLNQNDNISETITSVRQNESILSPSNCFDSSIQQQNLFTTDEYDPLWLEFVQSLNSTDNASSINETSTIQSNVAFDTLFREDDDDDEEFVGPDDINNIENPDEEKRLRVSKRELALLLKESAASPNEAILHCDQYESLWTEFLASLQTGHENEIDKQNLEQNKSIITATTEDDDNDDDPEFRLPDTDYEVEDDFENELHVSKRELALLLQDNESLLNQDQSKNNLNEDFTNPESISSTTTNCSTRTGTFAHQITFEQRNILQYQLTAYIQLLTQYILLRREMTNSHSSDDHLAQQLFKDLIYFRDKHSNSILNVSLLREAQKLLESPVPSNRRKPLGNHLPFYLMDTFCKSSAFLHDSLLPTCLLTSANSIIPSLVNSSLSRNFVSGEDCLMALGLEQNDVKLLIIGHSDRAINDRLNSLRYARVRRGKQNPIRAFYTYGSVPDASLSPWYIVPFGFDINQIYRNGLIEKVNVIFPSWFRLSYKRSRQLTKRLNNSRLSTTTNSVSDTNDNLSSSTVYVVVESPSSNSQATTTTTSPNKVLQQIHMLHLLNSYPKLQPKQK